MENEIDRLIKIMSRIPGLGPRSARRAVLHLFRQREALMQPLLDTMKRAYDTVQTCTICGNLDMQSPCSICAHDGRDKTTICVVEDVADVWAFERGNIYKGQYHVMGGLLSAVDGIGPEQLKLNKLVSRVREAGMHEVVVATPATVEGQTTAHYIAELIKDTPGVKVTRLARGIPMGGELDYMDDGTLIAALKARSEI